MRRAEVKIDVGECFRGNSSEYLWIYLKKVKSVWSSNYFNTFRIDFPKGDRVLGFGELKEWPEVKGGESRRGKRRREEGSGCPKKLEHF